MAKRWIVCLLSLALICSCLVGCGSKAPKETSAPTTEPTQPPTTEPTQPPTTEATEPPRKEYTPVELAEYVGDRTVTVTAGNAVGSGFFIDSEGTLVTNYHVIEGEKDITVDVQGGKKDVSVIVDFSKVYDLAILKIEMEDTPYLEPCREVKPGESVYAVGSSLGVLDGSFTAGTVSSVKRTYGKIECIQMDTSISQGNSGGPLVNVYGEVVGINAFSYVNGQNTNLAIKISMLDKLDQQRNLSLTSYREWYDKETSRSYSPFDIDVDYFYSTVNRYEVVTGQKCKYSVEVGGSQKKGYVDMSLYYGYAYKVSELDQYTDYLSSIGFAYDTDLSSENEYFYYSVIDDVYLLLEVDTQNDLIEIMPLKPSALELLSD